LLRELLKSVQAVLGDQFIGMYLEGSLASGDFDRESDIDFVVVTDQEISDDLFSALKTMHERIAALDSPWADELEGFYLADGRRTAAHCVGAGKPHCDELRPRARCCLPGAVGLNWLPG
jgi:predicted nucleotidyltransferase